MTKSRIRHGDDQSLIGKWPSAVKERNMEKKVSISSQNAKASPHKQRERGKQTVPRLTERNQETLY
jgi:hypothetical protein